MCEFMRQNIHMGTKFIITEDKIIFLSDNILVNLSSI